MTTLAIDARGAPIQAGAVGVAADVAFNGTSAQSAAFGSDVTLVRLVATEDCRILFGSNPTALSTSTRLPANVVESFLVTPGQKVAVIQDSTSGTLNITPYS